MSPDVFITDGELSLLFHSGIRLRPNDPTVIVAAFDPYRWTKPSGELSIFYRAMFCYQSIMAKKIANKLNSLQVRELNARI